mmetsp:Transcript_5891/g.12936  ORF Transcript_5891/g.12936 Transcript_5891/m.12936 type:complete len:1020 (+) Transcript_5891:128-3187(+)
MHWQPCAYVCEPQQTNPGCEHPFHGIEVYDIEGKWRSEPLVAQTISECSVTKLRRDDSTTSAGRGSQGSFGNPFLAVDLNDRAGVWHREKALVKALGVNPAEQRRQEHTPSEGSSSKKGAQKVPAGLKNLGATCYLNSLLQYLFFNLDFRQYLLHASSESAAVGALQRVFALLAEGDKQTVDPTEFVEAARVNAVEEADATEFSALLLDWLERELGPSRAGTKGGGFVPELFRGEVLQTLTCLAAPGHNFESRERFYELRARLTAPPAQALRRAKSKGKASPRQLRRKTAAEPPVQLEQLLADTAFPEELLDGVNQYDCPKCERKVDARKHARLSQSPPYLHVTIERYHYDLQKGERQKLSTLVSFPRRLEVRLSDSEAASGGGRTPEVPVLYDCIGFLEHVSTSAHSGHYKATLLQEHEDADSEEPPSKRQCYDSADAAAGAPKHSNVKGAVGTWWSLDDDTVTKIDSKEMEDRIESSTAYLVLYRRSDHTPGTCAPAGASPSLPPPLSSFIASMNAAFAAECRQFSQQEATLERIVAERQRAVNALVQALRQHTLLQKEAQAASILDANAFSIVPAEWLTSFLHGHPLSEDVDTDATDNQQVQGFDISYRGLMIQNDSCDDGSAEMLDPLALWCGKVKLLPTAALEAVGGLGGLDSALFMGLKGRLSLEACRSACEMFEAWEREREALSAILHRRMPLADARALEAEGRSEEAVWIETRMQTAWKKRYCLDGTSHPPASKGGWSSFLEEVQGLLPTEEAPDSGSGTSQEAAVDDEIAADDEADGSMEVELELVSTHPQIPILGGLLCEHNSVGKTRQGFLCRRDDAEKLLEASTARAEAFARLRPAWRSGHVFVSGLAHNKLLSFGDVCPQCGDRGVTKRPCSKMQAAEASEVSMRRLTIRRRYASGNVRKLGDISIPAASASTTTFREVRGMVKEQLNFSVSRLLATDNPAVGEREILGDEALGDATMTVIVEKEEVQPPATCSPREAEGAAFQRSIFRTHAPLPQPSEGVAAGDA